MHAQVHPHSYVSAASPLALTLLPLPLPGWPAPPPASPHPGSQRLPPPSPPTFPGSQRLMKGWKRRSPQTAAAEWVCCSPWRAGWGAGG